MNADLFFCYLKSVFERNKLNKKKTLKNVVKFMVENKNKNLLELLIFKLFELFPVYSI